MFSISFERSSGSEADRKSATKSAGPGHKKAPVPHCPRQTERRAPTQSPPCPDTERRPPTQKRSAGPDKGPCRAPTPSFDNERRALTQGAQRAAGPDTKSAGLNTKPRHNDRRNPIEAAIQIPIPLGTPQPDTKNPTQRALKSAELRLTNRPGSTHTLTSPIERAPGPGAWRSLPRSLSLLIQVPAICNAFLSRLSVLRNKAHYI